MINKLIEGFYTFLFNIIGTFTAPISNAINNLFPGISDGLQTITGFFNGLTSYIAWFVYLIPKPLTINLLLAFIGGIVLLYPTMISIEIMGKLINFIKRIWPFGGK